MHPRLQELLTYAELSRDELLSAVAAVDLARAHVTPRENGWSVVQVLEHLALAQSGSVRALFRGLRNARAAGLGQETEDTSLAPMIAELEGRMNGAKREAPEFTRPTSTDASVDALLARLAEALDGLRTWAAEADGADLSRATFPHPALGELSLYGWVVMMGAHERLHARQIREIDASVGAR